MTIAQDDSLSWDSTLSISEYDIMYHELDTFHDNVSPHLLSSQMVAAKNDWGLKLESSANYYFREVSDLENTNPLRSIVSTGISWNTLSQGYTANKMEARRIENLQKLAKIERKSKEKHSVYEHLYNRIIYWNHKSKLESSYKRSMFLKSRLELCEELYHRGEIQWEQKVKIEQEIASVSIDIESAEHYIKSFDNIYSFLKSKESAKLLPDVKLDLNMVMSKNLGALNEYVELLQSNIDIQEKQSNLPSLNIRTRFNYRQGNSSTELFPSVGIQFQIPIAFSKHEKKSFIIEKEMIERRESLAEVSRQKELMNYFYEFQFKRKHYQQYRKELKSINQQLFKSQLAFEELLKPGFIWASINLIDRRQQIELACLDVLKDMHLLILKIYTKSLVDKPSQLIEQEDHTDNKRVLVLFKIGDRDSAQIEFVSNYLSVNNWKEILISKSRKMKSDEFRKAFTDKQLKVRSSIDLSRKTRIVQPNQFDSIFELQKEIKRLQLLDPELQIIIDDIDAIINLDRLQLTDYTNEKF